MTEEWVERGVEMEKDGKLYKLWKISYIQVEPMICDLMICTSVDDENF